MSYILFCKGKRAEKPYFVADIRKKIYTIEELCYYLYHNTTLCGEELVKIQLANWIGHQLGFMDLFESILSILRKDLRPEKVASQIFAYTNYLTKSEREAVCERIRKNSPSKHHTVKLPKFICKFLVVRNGEYITIVTYRETTRFICFFKFFIMRRP